MPGVENRVEAEFLHPVLLGESILPYRVFRPVEGVVPITPKGETLDAAGAANRGYIGLHGWMSQAERVWNDHAESEMTLAGRWNYHNELGAQFPLAPLRVLYAASGTIPAACLLRSSTAVVEHAIYWCSVSKEEEGLYLTAVMNSETTRARAAAYQARGQWGARHFDKVVFNLPIPRFDPGSALHAELAAAREAEDAAARIDLPAAAKFQRARALVRAALADAGLNSRIDALVGRLLDGT